MTHDHYDKWRACFMAGIVRLLLFFDRMQQLQMNNKGETELLEFNKRLFYNDTKGKIV